MRRRHGTGMGDLLVALFAAPLLAAVGAAVGAVVAGALVLVGVFRMLPVLLAGVPVEFEDDGFGLHYIGAFVAIGAVLGLLLPLCRWWRLLYAVSLAIGGAVSFFLLLEQKGPVSTWRETTWALLLALTLAFGLALGYAARRIARDMGIAY